jgi:hypothetical protein
MRFGKSCVVIFVYTFAVFSGYAFGFREFDAKETLNKWKKFESEFRGVRNAFHEISMNEKINTDDRSELNYFTMDLSM